MPSSLPATVLPDPIAADAVHPGYGRATIVARVDRWLAGPRSAPDGRAVLVVLDVDLDRALPVGDAEEGTRRLRLGLRVQRALDASIGDRDAVARIDSGRFAVLRTGLPEEADAVGEAMVLARRVEASLSGRVEGLGVRVTCGGTTLLRGATRGGRATLGAVTGAMLAGKLMSDDRVVVVTAPAG
jgi:predicted signal transduction protein with EAL and GGDEF domain